MQEPFRIKVQRITKPKIIPNQLKTLNLPHTTSSDEKSIYSEFVPFSLNDSYYQLNPDFGKMNVGETLQCVISVINISNYEMISAVIQTEMTSETSMKQSQMSSNPNVVDSVQLKNMQSDHIKPHQAIVFPIEHTVETKDTYYLSLTIYYKHSTYVQTSQESRQQKRFKFDAKLPYDITERKFNDSINNRVFLELTIANSSKSALFFKKLVFNALDAYKLVPIRKDEKYPEKLHLNQGESHKLLYCLQVNQDDVWSKKSNQMFGLANLGFLQTSWFNENNGFGKSDSDIYRLEIPEPEVVLSYAPISKLYKDVMFPLEITIQNKTENAFELLFNINDREFTGIRIIGQSKNECKIQKNGAEKLVLFLLPTRLGIYKIQGFRIFNKLSQKEVKFNDFKGISVEEIETSVQENEHSESLL